MYYGPGVPVDESKFPSEEEQKRLREKAQEDMVNIGMAERERRRQGGEIAYKVAIAYSLVSSIFLDDGSFGGHLARFAIVMVRILQRINHSCLSEKTHHCSNIHPFFKNDLSNTSPLPSQLTLCCTIQPLFFAQGYTKSADTGL